MTKEQFIAKIAPYAVSSMKESGISAALTIAQAALESAWGRSGLTVQANNLFGVKGTSPAGSITLPTREFSGGRWVTVNAAFRAYRNWGESIADHAKLLTGGVSWNRQLYSKVIGADARTAAQEVAKAGYATDPGYAGKLIALMDEHGLYTYDGEGKPTEDKAQPVKSQPGKSQPDNLQSGEAKPSNAPKEDPLQTPVIRDISQPSAWAEQTWKEAVANGYFDGTRPGASLTREEGAAVINKLRRNFLRLIAGNTAGIAALEERLAGIEQGGNEG